MLLAKSSKLGKVGDTQHLVMARQAPKLVTDNTANPTTNPLVDFIEDQRGDIIGACQDVLQRQHQPGGLASGSDAYERFQPLPWIGRSEEHTSELQSRL